MNSDTTLARKVIGEMLDGQSPNGATPAQLGQFGEVYAEMARAHQSGGTDAARKVFASFAKSSPAIAALRAADPTPPKKLWNVADLLSTTFPDPKFAVPGMLPVGLVVLAGRPKLGKSWLSLQIAIAVGTGGMVLNRKVDKGRVLYLALEDNPRRLQDRLKKQKAPGNTDVDFRFEWEPLAVKNGVGKGANDLIEAIQTGGYSLVVMDTISRALGRADQMDQADMNVLFGTLQRIAIEREISLLLVDHHRKSAGGAGDVIDDVMGATSKVGVADAAIGIYRERGQTNATLKTSGRDIEELELSIKFDKEFFTWQLEGTASGVKQESQQADIITAITELGGKASAAQIAKWLGKLPNNITRELNELVNKGLVFRGERNGRSVPYMIVDRNDTND